MSKLIVAVLTLLLGPAIAYATETYTVTYDGFITAPTQFSFTELTIPPSGDTTSITQISGAVVTEFSWNSNGLCPSPVAGTFTEANACITYSAFLSEAFAPGSFLTDGIYTSLSTHETVMISGRNSGVTPEPPTVVLFVTGLVILVARRNR
jgi:hypothetical protein